MVSVDLLTCDPYGIGIGDWLQGGRGRDALLPVGSAAVALSPVGGVAALSAGSFSGTDYSYGTGGAGWVAFYGGVGGENLFQSTLPEVIGASG